MTQSVGERARRAFGRWIDVVRRRALIVVLMAAALTAAGLAYTLNSLAINTSTVDMIAEDVPFRQHDIAFIRAFPQFQDTVVAVLDGPTPEAVDAAAERLAATLSARPELFRDVHLPGGDAFFERHALLFLDADELAELADRLAAAGPLLATLAQDPSLRGLADVLDLVLEHADPDQAADIARFLDRLAEVADAAGEDRPLDLSWQALLGLPGGAEPADAMRFVVVQPNLDHAALRPAAEALDAIREHALALGIGLESGVRLRLTGDVALDDEELESVQLGGQTAGLLSLLLVATLLVWGLRSAGLVVATVATLLMGLVWTATFATLVVGHLNLLSVAFAILFVGLGVDFGIHMCLRYREETARRRNWAAALRRAGLGVGGALGLSALSAAAGFFAFLPTDYQGLAELGLISGAGMFIALLASLTVLPAFIALGRPGGRAAGPPPRPPLLARFVTSHHRTVLGTALVGGLLGVAALPFVRFDSNPLNLKDPADESVATFLDLAEDPETTPYTVDALAGGLAEAERLAARLETLPEVAQALTLTSFVPEDQDTKLAIIDDMAMFLGPALAPPTEATTPDATAPRTAFDQLRLRLAAVAAEDGPLGASAARVRAALAGLAGDGAPSDAALADLEGRLTVHLPRTLDQLSAALAAEPVELADLPPEVRERWVTADGRARVEVYPAGDMTDDEALSRFAAAVLAVAPAATGMPVIITQAGEAVVAAFLEASVLALFLITALLLVVLRRPGDVVMVLAPLTLAALMTAAAAVLLGLPFNFANVIVLPLIFALGVSGGIHVVLRRRQQGESGRVLASSTPRAVLLSALTTVAAFGSLALSGHQGMTSMGQLLTVGIGFTLLAILVVLPSLMTAVAGRRDDAPEPA